MGKLGTILLVDDDYISFMLIKEILKEYSHELLYATNGQEAVDLWQNHPEIELVLMDIRMPVMGGVEATQHIKSFSKDLPIIAVTANALFGDKYKFSEAGFDDYILKPINKEKLVELVKKYLSVKIMS